MRQNAKKEMSMDEDENSKYWGLFFKKLDKVQRFSFHVVVVVETKLLHHQQLWVTLKFFGLDADPWGTPRC